MARLTPRAASAILLLVAGLALGMLVQPRRLGDASNYLLMADSLWVDGDLVYTSADLARAEALALFDHPAGLYLSLHDWGYGYAKPPLYPAIAAPFHALLGVRGFYVLNGLLLAALVVLGADILSHRLRWRVALAAAALVFAGSVTSVYLHWIDPYLLCSALVAAAVAAERRARLIWSAVFLVAAASCRPPYLALALAPIALCTWERRWRALAGFAIAGALAASLFLAFNRLAAGQWSPYGGARSYFVRELPYQSPGAPVTGAPEELSVAGGARLESLGHRSLEFLFGRFAGVLVYYPALLACALWSSRWEREKLAWLLALVAGCAALLVALPSNSFGGQHAVGNRLFVLLPVALVFVDFVAWRTWRALGGAALLLLALPMVRQPVRRSLEPGHQMLELPYRVLPIEWHQAARISFPAACHLALIPLDTNNHGCEGNGLWTRGGTRAEFLVLRFDDAPLRLLLRSPHSDIEVSAAGTRVVAARHADRVTEVTLTRPVATYRDESNGGRHTAVYGLRIATDTGVDGDARILDDQRDFGAYVEVAPPALE